MFIYHYLLTLPKRKANTKVYKLRIQCINHLEIG